MLGVDAIGGAGLAAQGSANNSFTRDAAYAFDKSLQTAQSDATPASTMADANAVAASDDETVRADADSITAPGFAESLIPVWGAGRQAVHDFQNGNWGWGLVNTAMAVSDVFLVKAAATATGKVDVMGITRIAGHEGIERAATEVAEKTVKANADDIAASGFSGAAAKLTGQVIYGASDLSQAAMAFRLQNGIKGAGNVAVFEYAENGVTKTLAMASKRGEGGGHAERLIAAALEKQGVDPSAVTHIYSELQPCTVLFGGGCKRFIQETFKKRGNDLQFRVWSNASFKGSRR